MDEKTIEFITFCTEMYARQKNITGGEAAAIFGDFGVFEFLDENYLELHTQGKEFIIPLIENFIAERKK